MDERFTGQAGRRQSGTGSRRAGPRFVDRIADVCHRHGLGARRGTPGSPPCPTWHQVDRALDHEVWSLGSDRIRSNSAGGSAGERVVPRRGQPPPRSSAEYVEQKTRLARELIAVKRIPHARGEPIPRAGSKSASCCSSRPAGGRCGTASGASADTGGRDAGSCTSRSRAGPAANTSPAPLPPRRGRLAPTTAWGGR